MLPWTLGPVIACALLSGAATSPERDAETSTWWASVSQRLRGDEYELSLGADGWSAPNRAQGFRVLVDGAQLLVAERAVSVTDLPAHAVLSLALDSVGRAQTEYAATAGPMQARGARVTIARGSVLEWFVNQPRGVEHGFTLPMAPTGRGDVRIALAVRGSLRPVPRGAGAVGFVDQATGVEALRYADLHVIDASGHSLPAALELDRERIVLRFDDRDAAYPVTVDPLLTSASWSATGDQTDASFGASVAPAGDVDGDGFSDVLVGAPGFDNGEVDEGRAALYLGSVAGLALTPAWSVEGDQSGARLGSMVATAGDVDGNGCHDVLVAASGFDDGEVDEGAAFLYLGATTGLSSVPAWSAEGDQADASLGGVATAGDLNGDGFDDVVIAAAAYDGGVLIDSGRASVYLGSATGLALTPSWTADGDQDGAVLGSALATAGDVNADGFADVLVGVSGQDSIGFTDDGRASVYLGSGGGLDVVPAWSVDGAQDGARLGGSLANAGDVNGDGYADVLVGASEHDGAFVDAGEATLYLGSATGLALVPALAADGTQDGARLGASLATAGDVNGDGFADVILGAPGFDSVPSVDDGRAQVHLGFNGGLRSVPSWIVAGEQDGAAFGACVATAGDVNGDGYSDVLVGAPAFDDGEADEGRATLYLGGAGALSTSASWSVASAQFQAGLGLSVAAAGDVNGDGFADVVVGAPFFDNGQVDEGRAYLFLGSAAGLTTVAAWSFESDQAFAKLGWSVATAHDTNGDGYSEVMVGVPFFDNGTTDEGRVLAFGGSPSGLTATPVWSVESNSSTAELGFSVAAAGDVNGDGCADVIVGAPFFGPTDEGQASLYLGGGGGLSLAPAWTESGGSNTAQLGWSVASAGDVDGDGYSDVIVGAPFFDNGQTDEGRAVLFTGSRRGVSVGPMWSVESDEGFASLGWSVASAGDVNGDGYSDLIVGAPLHDHGEVNEGGASLYLGAAPAPSLVADWTAESNTTSASFGRVVASAGDVNGDGFSDVLVAAPFFANGEASEGAVFVYHGSSVGLGAEAAWQVEGNQAFAELGWSAAGAGDVNGDGFGDLVAGAPLFDGVVADEGAAFTFYGNDGGGLDRNPRQQQVAGSGPIDLLGRSRNPGWFRLAVVGRTAAGRGRLRLEWEVKPSAAGFDGSLLARGATLVDTGLPAGTGSSVDLAAIARIFGSSRAAAPRVSSNERMRDASQPYHWRLRIVSPSPFFPRSPWLSPSGNGAAETDLRL